MITNLGRRSSPLLFFGVLLLGVLATSTVSAEKPTTGPATEQRFPPLILPEGFRATLFACDPLVEYPSVIALGPEAGTLFVAHDYVTGLGVEIVRRDEVRLLQDTDGDGYADHSKVYAGGFNSIQGLAYHSGAVYVMHAPLLTSLSDTNGDGVADQRRDLIQGLGLPPEENSNRLHCANGVVVGHDGWLYLALGDRGCDVLRPDGDRLVFREGGILRCRPDGQDLHVFSHGLRNIYDVALDEELNVFVRDNENDGGDYMIRVCHCFHGSDHGYPYLYYKRPEEAMPPLADLGRGSSAGGTAYLETAFPPAYRESLFFCEWGRAVVRYQKQRAGSSFALMQEVDFASGAPDDPYGFKPTDLVVDRDGSLLISDWCDGQRPKRGRGRIYRITFPQEAKNTTHAHDVAPHTKLPSLLKYLDSDRYTPRVAAQQAIERRGAAGVEAVNQAITEGRTTPRGRLHAVWILAHVAGQDAIDDLFKLAETDSDARVRAQCVRALADLADPVLKAHRLDAGRGDESVCRRLSRLAQNGADARVRLEVMIALGRLRWSGAPAWLNGSHLDPALSHAALVMLRRADDWPEVLKLLDVNPKMTGGDISLRILARGALADRIDDAVVDGILARLASEPDAERRREHVDLLSRVYKKPAAWSYWGFRPAPRPADSVPWQRSETIATALNDMLRDSDSGVRALAVRRMLREEVPIQDDVLTAWLHQESDTDAVAAILEALQKRPAAEVRDRLEAIVCSKTHVDQNRLAALAMFTRDLDATTEGRLLEIAGSLEDGVVLAGAIRQLADRPAIEASSLFLETLDSRNADVRAAASAAILARPVDAAVPLVMGLLQDSDLRVQRAAAALAGRLEVRAAVKLLLAAADHSDLALRAASLQSLAALREPDALPLAVRACDFPDTQVSALACLAAVGGPHQLEQVAAVAEKSRSIDVLTASAAAILTWQKKLEPGSEQWRGLERAVAKIQSASGLPLVWRVKGLASPESARQAAQEVADPAQSQTEAVGLSGWSEQLVHGTDAHVLLKAAQPGTADTIWLAMTDVLVKEPHEAEFLTSADGTLRVCINGREVFARTKASDYQPDAERFDASLVKGRNRVLVEVVSGRKDARFQLRFRRKSSKADHERLTQLALTGKGSAIRGRELFLNAEKSQCIKCHRLGDQGGKIGPDLAGIGSRFSRIHLVESILEPSRTVAPSYETMVVAKTNGLVVNGVKISETETLLTLGDNQGKVHQIPKSEIDVVQVQPRSTMPDGLEKRLTDREFVDLIGFLLSQRKAASQ